MVDEEEEAEFSPVEDEVARDTLERYSGSPADEYQPYLLLTNFPRYVQEFAVKRNLKVYEGSMFTVAHSISEQITILDFKIGSPAASLVIDLCAHLPIKASLMLGMCGGLRRHYQVGDYFVPVAAIRGDATSDFYFPKEVPALGNFLVQKVVTNVLDSQQTRYHIGITHTTNMRFWEFNRDFRTSLKTSRAQAIEMECATLFMASYYHKMPLGAILLISDLPLEPKGVKTKKKSESVYAKYTADHVEKGVKTMTLLRDVLKMQPKGVFRAGRRRFLKEGDEQTAEQDPERQV